MNTLKLLLISYFIIVGTACEGPQFHLELKIDNFPSEITWKLQKSGLLVDGGGPYDQETMKLTTHTSDPVCLDGGDYVFDIFDSANDGICCGYGDGYYKISIGGNIVKEGGNYGAGERYVFSIPDSTVKLTKKPSIMPSDKPSEKPTVQTSKKPSIMPSDKPSEKPTVQTSKKPSIMPSDKPSEKPIVRESDNPSSDPSTKFLRLRLCA